MPTAEPFTALGAGNGFPFCPTRVDVEDYDYWITLGGFKKTDGGSPSPAQINLSLTNAMKLFWNGYAINGTVSTAQTLVSSVNLNDNNRTIRDLNGNVIDPLEFDGRNRVCWNSYTADNTDFFDDINTLSFYESYLQISGNINSLYVDGDFVGYGTGGMASAYFFDSNAHVSSHPLRVSVLSYEEFEQSDLSINFQYAYTTLSGIPVLAKAWAYNPSDTNPTSLSVSDSSGSAEISSIDFYTYT